MIKQTLLVGVMMIAAPAFAQQTTTPSTPMPPPSAPAAPGTSTSSPQPSDPMQSAPTAPTTDTAAQAQSGSTASTQPATSADQIAQVVETDFAKYDADANGSLNASEFGSWMTTLRASTDSAASADSASSKKWLKAAFAQADIDKSKSVSKDELTGFLAKNKG